MVQSFFSVMLDANHDNNNDGGFTFPGPEGQNGSGNDDWNRRGETVEQKTSMRAGLVERMAARAGHNAPRLNTDIIKPVDGSQNQQVQSAYLTISPNLSPASFLESPVFLSNSLVSSSEAFLKSIEICLYMIVFCSNKCLELFEDEFGLGQCAFYYAK